MKKQKKTKETTSCKVCQAWDGFAIPERDRGDKKFRCLDADAPANTRKRANGTCWKIAASPPETTPELPPEPEVVQDQAPKFPPEVTDWIDMECDGASFFVLSEAEPYFEEMTEIEVETYLSETIDQQPFIGSAEDEFGAERCFKCGDWISSAGYCKRHGIEIRAEGTCVIGGYFSAIKIASFSVVALAMRANNDSEV